MKFPRRNLAACGNIVGCQNWRRDISRGQGCCSTSHNVQESRYSKELWSNMSLVLFISYRLKLNRSHSRMFLFTYCQVCIFPCGGTFLESSSRQTLVSFHTPYSPFDTGKEVISDQQVWKKELNMLILAPASLLFQKQIAHKCVHSRHSQLPPASLPRRPTPGMPKIIQSCQ